jgi:hypothetical protein
MEPVQVFLSFAHEDEELAIELEAHLQGMVKQGVIRLWSERQVAFGSNWIAARAHQLESAGLLVFLVSASFLASDLTFASLTTALQRQVSGTARVAPILVRACDWRASPLDALAVIPANQVPVASWPNRDEAWAEVVRELRSLLQFGAAPEESAPPEAPAEIRRIEEIFRTEGQPDITYVEPAQYKTLRRCLRTLGRGWSSRDRAASGRRRS